MEKTDHPNTKWKRIKEDIEMKIVRSELKGGTKIPSISEMAEQYVVSKSIAQKAVESMFADDIIIKQQNTGSTGYFVKPYTVERLRTKYAQKISKMVDEVVCLAKDVGLDEKELTEILDSCVEKLRENSSSR